MGTMCYGNIGDIYLYNLCVIGLSFVLNIGHTLIPWWVTMGDDVTGYEDR